ncbi:CHAT domain-containing protein [Acrocarpospora sp. B8E8]|uniref:CHAT domain-containing tetratricopeptide repeat protein n=1 Tax=Acrocarpospora sp. B8E8 TaxID=3153572 RepID=UPI00325C5B87
MDFFAPEYGGPSGKSPGDSPERLLAQATAATRAGDMGAALDLLQRATWLAPHGSALLVRCLAWTRLARIGRYAQWPDGCGAVTPEMEAREPWPETSRLDEERLSRAYQAATRGNAADLSLDLNAGVILRVLADLPAAQSTLRSAVTAGSTPEDLNALLEVVTGRLSGLRGTLADPGLNPVAALVCRAMATLCHEAGMDERAAELLAEAEQRCAGDRHGYALAQLTRGDWAAAIRTSPLLLDHWPVLSLGARTGHAEARVLPGRQIRPDLAERAYAAAERVLGDAAEDEVVAQRLLAALKLRRAYLARLAGDGAATVELATEAEKMARESGDQRLRWTAWTHLALAAIAAGEPFDPAEGIGELAVWARGPGSLSLAEGLGALCSQEGHHAARAGHYQRAACCHRLARRIHGALGFAGNEAQSVTDLGTLRLSVGDRAGAQVSLAEAAALFEADIRRRPALALRESVRLVGILLEHLRLLNATGGDPDALRRTADRIRSAMARLPLLNDDPEPADLEDEDDDTLAPNLDELLEAWLLVKNAGDALEAAEVHVPASRAAAALARGQAREASLLFTEAMRAAERADPERRDLHRAHVLGRRREWARAAAAYRAHRAYRAHQAGRAAAFGMPDLIEPGADTLVRAGEHELAAATFVSYRAYADAEIELRALRGLLGEDWWRRSLEPWTALEIEGETARGLAAETRAAGRGPGVGYGRAVGFYREALRSIEVVRGEAARRATADPRVVSRILFGAARCLLQAADAARSEDADRADALAAEAFGVGERSRDRAFLDLLEARRATGEVEIAALAGWRAATAEVALPQHLAASRLAGGEPPDPRLAERSARAEQRLAALEQELARDNPALWRALDTQAEPLGAEAVARLLPEGTLLVSYLLREDRLLVWAIGAAGPLVSRVLDVDGVAGLVRAVRNACANGGDPDGPARELAAVLLAPVHEALLTHRDVLVVPSGALHSLPFGVLPWRGAPLAAQRTLSVLPGAGALPLLRPVLPKALAEGRLLAVGDPAFMRAPGAAGEPGRHARRLPASGLEAGVIARQFPGEGEALLGDAATKDAVLAAAGASVLHLATHAWLDESSPLSSAVLFADGQALHLAELAGAALGADLVVLSACRTGQGGVSPGDDVRGLISGVLATGAGAAVITLWPVHDLATALFMTDFHRRLRTAGSVPEALRRTQEVFRRRSPAQHQRAVMRLLAASGDADGRLADARAALAAKGADYWSWLDTASHPRTWAAFVAVAAPAE